jgi:acetylornithine deacetylase
MNDATKGDWEKITDPIICSLQEAVAIDSVNPELPGATGDESAMLDFIAEFFKNTAIEVETFEVVTGRSNIVATLKGKSSERAILFESHMDTASPYGMSIPPFTPNIREGNLYGRGSCDTKAGGIAMMHAMLELHDSGETPPNDILFAGVIDEESEMKGSRHLANMLNNLQAVVISEPTELEVIYAHKGILFLRVESIGKAAHGSKPYLGINAIEKAMKFLSLLKDTIDPLFLETPHPILGHATYNIGTINGGVQANFVPDRCDIAIDFRFLPNLPSQRLIEICNDVAMQIQSSDENASYHVHEPLFLMEPLSTKQNSNIVSIASTACDKVLGYSKCGIVPYGSDGSAFSAKGVETIVLGPGSIDQAHAAVEWVEIKQVIAAKDIYKQIMLSEFAKPVSRVAAEK